MVEAYGAVRLEASLHGVDASSTKQWVGSPLLRAINGHRDAASTARPGRYLYAKIPEIRARRRGPARLVGTAAESNLARTAYPTWWCAGPATAGASSSRPAG